MATSHMKTQKQKKSDLTPYKLFPLHTPAKKRLVLECITKDNMFSDLHRIAEIVGKLPSKLKSKDFDKDNQIVLNTYSVTTIIFK